jgi:hypothetical protein
VEFWGACPDLTGPIIDYITDQAVEVTYRTFARHADLSQMREDDHPAMWHISSPDNWAVAFYRSELPSGRPIYFFDWSRIEHVFVDPDDWPDREEEDELARLRHNPSVAPDQAVAEVQAVLTPDLLLPRYAALPRAHPYAGHCYAATEALYHLLGGKQKGWIPAVTKHEGDDHWWLENQLTGERIDATAAQFCTPVPYGSAHRGSGRPWWKRKRDAAGELVPSKRAAKIIQRVLARRDQ